MSDERAVKAQGAVCLKRGQSSQRITRTKGASMSRPCDLTGCYDSPELAAFQQAYETACCKLYVNPKPSNSDDNKDLRDALAIAVLRAANLGERDPLTLAMFAVATGFGAARHKAKFGPTHSSGD
jgi:hypothetical protein